MAATLSSRQEHTPLVAPPDGLDGVRVAAGDGRDVTAAALEAWRPWPALLFLVPGIALAALVSARPGSADPAQVTGLGLGWLTLGIVAAPHIALPRFHRGDRALPVPAAARAAWLVPIVYLVVSLFATPDLALHEQLLIGVVGVLGSAFAAGAAWLAGRHARRALTALLAGDATAGEPTWASTYVEQEGDVRVTRIPDGGAELRAGAVVLGGGPEAALDAYARRALAHDKRRLAAAAAAAALHAAAATVAIAL